MNRLWIYFLETVSQWAFRQMYDAVLKRRQQRLRRRLGEEAARAKWN